MRDMRTTEETVEEAAALLANRLMRLMEAVEIEDALHYSQIPQKQLGWVSPRTHRIRQLRDHYRQWFNSRGTT